MPDSAIQSTLHHITLRKLLKQQEHRVKFEGQRLAILEQASAQDTLEKQISTLLDGCARDNITLDEGKFNVRNIKSFLEQSRHDPSLSQAILKRWKNEIELQLDLKQLKHQYAELFGQLVSEWIENVSPAAQQQGEEQEEGFEQVGRQEMHDQRREWESYALFPKQTDPEAIERYLNDIFAGAKKETAHAKSPLALLREQIQELDTVTPDRFSAAVVEKCIDGVLKADLFAGPRRSALLNLKAQGEDTLKEVADILNMDLDSLDDWKWDPSPVSVEMRRQVNGKYRFYMNEELHQAILLHFIGARFAGLLKTSFTKFFKSRAWFDRPHNPMSKQDRLQRAYYTGDTPDVDSRSKVTVRNTRRDAFVDDFFMTQLPESFNEGSRDYNADFDDDDDASGTNRKSPLVIKQTMLRLATTEAIMSTQLYGSFTILQSDFKWFGPGLPHSTIFAVLKFFGVQQKWIDFFRKFLTTPMIFSNDGPEAEERRRQRGIPMSHPLSDAFGELVMFCLDYAVNQRTGGGNLYRFHDDLWFWGQQEACAEAWRTIQEFSKVMGMDLNEQKTGSVTIGATAADVPAGPVRWGFLELDAATGRWLINKADVETHIAELKRQLGACTSLFAWVQAYNAYVDRFFGTNFGQPAVCLGQEHVHMIIETFEHIHRSLFGSDGSVIQYLRNVIHQRFGVKDVPDGFFYLPVELGGLELRNPFIPLHAQLQLQADPTSVRMTPKEQIAKAIEDEKQDYERHLERFRNGQLNSKVAYKPENEDTFMSLDDYLKFVEQTSFKLQLAYQALLGTLQEDEVYQTPAMVVAMRSLPIAMNTFSSSGFGRNWSQLSPYWKWVLELYGQDLIEHFGGLAMVEHGLIPLSIVKVLRSEKVRWQG